MSTIPFEDELRRGASDATTLFAGGGEMGALLARVDWAATPLGPVAGWSQALRTTVGLLLRNRFPMLLWWGPKFVQIYNDAYRPIPGAKHPLSLGQPAAECWSEIWHIIGPMIEAPFRGEPATWSDDLPLLLYRRGFAEETHFKVAYSPVPDESTASGIGGVLATVAETTEEVYARRQLATLRDLAGQVSDATTAEDACARAARILEENAKDIPCALFYLLDSTRKAAVLVGSAGFRAATEAPPPSLAIDDEPGAWPVARALAGRHAVVACAGPLELPKGAWKRAPEQVVVLPLASPEQPNPYGILVVAVSPHRELNEQYRTFLDLAAAQVSSAIRNARAYQYERERAEQLAELDRAKTLFFSNVSHEFRTPLTLMLGPTEDALRSPTPRIEGEALELLHRNELRLLKLVNTLLDFARTEAGRARASFVETDLATLTRDLASAFEHAVTSAGLRFEVDCPAIERPTFVDREMWEKVVLNLLSNALKFTFEGSIRVRLRRAGDFAELTVADTGVGIPADALPRIFDRFHRVAETRSRTHEGSGIGLALVNEIVRLHGGRIEVTSEPGHGSRFTVRIPFGSAHLPADQIGTPSPLASTALGVAPYLQEARRWSPSPSAESSLTPADGEAFETPGRPMHDARVLVADDNRDMREYLGRLLGATFSVETVPDGLLALEAARRRCPDLVLSDVMMPNLDGFGLLRELRADPRTRSIPVVLLSARAGEDARIEGAEQGADDYLVKPFSARELVARVRAQIEIARLRSRANAESEKFTQLFMQSPVPIAVFTGPDHRYTFASPSYYAMTGRGSEILGRPVREVFTELGPTHEVIEVFDRAFQSGEPVLVQERYVPLRDAGGAVEDRWFTYLVQPLRDRQGAVEGVLNIAVDVTQLMSTRRSLEQARRAAEEANQAKDDFLAMLGHELRNPLAPIATAIHLLKLRSNGALSREIGVIERQSQHITRLVDDLLDVSRIALGKVALHKVTTEMAELVAAAIELASPAIERGRHALVVQVPKEGLAVDVDTGRMAQVLANLLTNAAKYTPEEGRIVVAALRDGGEVVISVEDSGAGISAELLPHVFELFVQSRRTLDRAQGGLGLGLALVKNLVTLHGGRVSAESQGSGRGSKFTVRLPAAAHRAARQTPSWPPRAPPAARAVRLLIVDDNVDGAQMLAEVLEAAGYVTAIAHDGPSALRLAETSAPHIALLDLGLPVMDGYELATRLREQWRAVRLVAITGYGQDHDRQRARNAGFQAHLTKPVNMQELEALLVRLAEGVESLASGPN